MANFLIFIAEVLFIIAYCFTNLLALRVLCLCGQVIYVIAGLIVGYDTEGYLSIIIFNAISAIINGVQIFNILKEKYEIFLPEETRVIHSKTFSHMSNSEFMKIYNLAKHETYLKGEKIISEDAHINTLMLLISGEIQIRRQEKVLGWYSFGNFVGEMSFISNANAVASAYVSTDEIECLKWDRDVLERLKVKNPHIYTKFYEALAINVADKLGHHYASS